jgi:hypothetical protein
MRKTYQPGRHNAKTLETYQRWARQDAHRQKANLQLAPEPCPVCGTMMVVDKDAGLYCPNGKSNMQCLHANLERRYHKKPLT